MNNLNYRKTFICSVVIGINLFLPQQPLSYTSSKYGYNSSQSEDIKLSDSDSIYIWHIGESDKYIHPIVISSKVISKQQLTNVLGIRAVTARKYIVSKSMMKELVVDMGSFIDNKPDTNDGSHGSFAVCIKQKNLKQSVKRLSVEDSTKLILVLDKKLCKQNEDLCNHITDLEKILNINRVSFQ